MFVVQVKSALAKGTFIAIKTMAPGIKRAEEMAALTWPRVVLEESARDGVSVRDEVSRRTSVDRVRRCHKGVAETTPEVNGASAGLRGSWQAITGARLHRHRARLTTF